MINLRIIAIIIIPVSALALLLANPLEQIHRVQDRRVEADAREILEVLTRYYMVFFEYPWDALGEQSPNETSVKSSWLQEPIAKGEAGPEFANRSSWNQIYVTQDSAIVYACFDPVSKQFQTRADEQARSRNGTLGCLSDCWICQNSE